MSTFLDDLQKKQGVSNTDEDAATQQSSAYTPFRESSATLDAKKRYDDSARTRVTTYEDMISKLRPQRSEEDERKERRRERSKAIISGIADMASAIGNLYHTARGGVSMWDPSASLSARNKARYDAAKAKRDAAEQAYTQARMRAMQRDDELTQAERTRTYNEYKDAYARDLQAYKDKREEDKREEDKQYKRERDAVADARNARDYAQKVADANRKYAQSERHHADSVSLAKQRIADARERRGGGSSGSGDFSAWDEDGSEHKFKSKAAADTYAKQHGTYHVENQTNKSKKNVIKDNDTTNVTTTTVKQVGYPQKPKPQPKPQQKEKSEPKKTEKKKSTLILPSKSKNTIKI